MALSMEDMLRRYYRGGNGGGVGLFPLGPWTRWISAGNSPLPLQNRELSFTLAGDVYVRYLSVKSLTDLKTLLNNKLPHKIDVGPVYDNEPMIAKHGATVVSRELVFDIDLTDYDDIRTCCTGAGICSKCWKFMAVACKVLDVALKDDFGFTSILWVYSGRRGIHCWVSCAEARTLSTLARSAVADYLAVIAGGESQAKKITLTTDIIHSSLKRACYIISESFEDIIQDQQFISTPEGLTKFIKLIPDEKLATEVNDKLSRLAPDTLLRWKTFLDIYKAFWCEHNPGRRLKHLVEEIQLQWCYPRLDINVSKGMNHLLKAPFSIHPKTEKVCVVFRRADVDKFNPDTVPVLSDLLDEQSPKHATSKAMMQEAISIFQTHVFALEKEEARRKRTAAESSLDF